MSLVLVTQSQHLDVEKTVDPCVHFFRVELPEMAEAAQTLAGAGMHNAIREAVYACGVGKERGAIQLEVDGVRMPGIAAGDEIAQHSERRPVLKRVVGHLV